MLAEELAFLEEGRDRSQPLVFHRKGKPLNRQLAGKAYSQTLRRLGIAHVRGTHMLRKTAATLANEVTGGFFAVSKLLDHSSPKVTMRYVAPVTSQKLKVADALNSVLRPSGRTKPFHEIASSPLAPRDDEASTSGMCNDDAVEMAERSSSRAVPQRPADGERPKLRLVK